MSEKVILNKSQEVSTEGSVGGSALDVEGSSEAILEVERVESVNEAMEDTGLPLNISNLGQGSDPFADSPAPPEDLPSESIRELLWSKVEEPLVREAPSDCEMRIVISRKGGVVTVAFQQGQDDLSRRDLPIIQRALDQAYGQFERIRRHLSLEDAWKNEN